MVKIKKKEKGVNFKTIAGESVKLVLEKKERIIKITIINSTYFSLNRRSSVILITLVTLALLSLILHILNVQISIGIFTLIVLELHRLCCVVKEENLVVVQCIGFQLTTKYMAGMKTIFIPWENVQTFFINEVIFRHKVIYVLNLLTKDMDNKEKLITLFLDTLPRLECLKLIYKNIKALQEFKKK